MWILGGFASADALRGQIRNELADDFVIDGATIALENLTNPATDTETESDPLGYFQLGGLTAGDQLRLTLSREGFETKVVELTLAANNPFESLKMRPLGSGTTHDITVQVAGAVSLLPVFNAPVKIHRYDGSGGILETRFGQTDAKGMLRFRGNPNGTYGFEVNALTEASRRQKYEEYLTPADQRVTINKGHILNVFLKPITQDLKVIVRGYDFKSREQNQLLGDVLVEIRGLNPIALTEEALHPRSDYTRFMPATGTVTDDKILISKGEVVFFDLPPIAYEVRVTRLGYVEQKIIIEPQLGGPEDGCLPFSETTPLEVDLQAEFHFAQVYVDTEDFNITQVDEFGNPTQLGVGLSGLNAKLIGIENTNTEGLEYETVTGLTLENGEVAAQFFENVMVGRYRVLVDGFTEQVVAERDIQPDGFFTTEVISEPYDLRTSGEGILEILPGSSQTARADLVLQSPMVVVTGQLLAADSLTEDDSPIYQPLANQRVVIESLDRDNHQVFPTVFETVTDFEGRFSAEVLPGGYGIRLPDADEYFGHQVIRRVGSAANPFDANRQRIYKWPLVEAFPEIDGLGDSFANQRFALRGIPISAGQTQHFELQILKEVSFLKATFSEISPVTERHIATSPEGDMIFHPISLLLNNGAQVQLASDGGNLGASLRPTDFESDRLVAHWNELGPGNYTALSENIDSYLLEGEFLPFRVVDWPIPGDAPDLDFAEEFYADGLIGIGVPPRPLIRHSYENFVLTRDDLDGAANPIMVKRWTTRIEDGEVIEEYVDDGEIENAGTFDLPGLTGTYRGGATIGSSITAAWLTGTNADGESYPVRLTPGSTLFLGGAGATPPTPLSAVSYTLNLSGRASSDPGSLINGAAYRMGVSNQSINTGSSLAGLREPVSISKSNSDNFFEVTLGQSRITNNGINPVIELDSFLEQGMEIKATVTDDGAPLAGQTVKILDRQGQLVSQLQTNEMGVALFNGLPGYADYILTMDIPGYLPIRLPLRASDAAEGMDGSTSLMHDVAIQAALITPPSVTSTGSIINRRGMFLPSVTRFGNVKAEDGVSDYRFFQAKDELKATWKVTLQPTTISVPKIDFAAGNLAVENTTGPDEIVAAYLIDERYFSMDGFRGEVTQPEEEIVFPVPLDSQPIEIQTMIDQFLQPKVMGFQTVQQLRTFVDQADSVTKAEDGKVTVQGTFQLWDLPPGKFEPVILVKTSRGAFATIDVYPPSGPANPNQLEGVQAPPWLASLLDTLGVAAGVASTQSRIEKHLPKMRFLPLPDFSATVELDQMAGEDSAYLKYGYSLKLKETVGQEGKASGLLSLGPGLLGAELEASASIQAEGRNKRIEIGVNAGVQTGELIPEKKIIKSKSALKIAPVPKITPSFKLKGGFSSSAAANFEPDASRPFDFEFCRSGEVVGTFAITGTVNDFARPIPYAGPVIGFLGDTRLLALDATSDVSVGIKESNGFRTRLPRASDQERKMNEMTIPRGERLKVDKVPLHHILGETETVNIAGFDIAGKPKTQFGVGYSTSLDLDVANKTYTAGVKFELGGPKLPGEPATPYMRFTVNPKKTWPLISRIDGEARIVAKTAQDFGGYLKRESEYKLANVPFSFQFGTETLAQHLSYDSRTIERGVLEGYPGTYFPDSTQVVTGLAQQASVSRSGNVMVYAADDPASSDDRIMLSRFTGGQWTAPVAILNVPRLGNVEVLERSNGEVLVAYSEAVSGQDLNDPFIDAWIRSLTVTQDGTVSPVANVTYLLSMPTEIKLSESDSTVICLMNVPTYTETQIFEQLFSCRLNGASWDPLVFEHSETGILDCEVIPDGAGNFLFTWINEQEQWRYKTLTTTWNTFANNIAGPLAGVREGNAVQVFALDPNGDFKVFAGTLPGGLVAGSDIPAGLSFDEMDALPWDVTGQPAILIAGAQQTSLGAAIHTLSLSPAGVVLEAPKAVSENVRGAYSSLSLAASPGGGADLLAQFALEESSQLRFFSIQPGLGLQLNDSDNDGLNDLTELRLIDSNEEDEFDQLSDIEPTGDFDGDGFSNLDEELAGTDPLNPLLFPVPTTLTLAEWIATEFPGETDQAIIGLDADPDQDGLVNLLEYVLGLKPLTPSVSGIEASLVKDEDTGVGHLELGFGINPNVTDYEAYPQSSEDLMSFIAADDLFEETGRSAIGGGRTFVTLRSISPISELTAQYYRLAVRSLNQ